MAGEPPDEYAEETEAVVREHLTAIEQEIRGVGQFEARRIVRRVKAWANKTERSIIQGDEDDDPGEDP